MKIDSGKSICNGELVIVRITDDLYDEVFELHKKNFMIYENISIATNLPGSQETIDEMEILLRAILKDGVSFAAKHVSTNQLVAYCANKMMNPSAGCTLDNVVGSFTTSAMHCIGEYLERMETSYSLFKEWNVDCVMEIEFLSTRCDFERKGLATKLSQHAIEFARNMMNGTVAEPECLPIHVRNLKPQAVCAIFTSIYSQRVGEKLGFETLTKVSHKDFVFQGKTFADNIDAIHEFSKFAAIRL